MAQKNHPPEYRWQMSAIGLLDAGVSIAVLADDRKPYADSRVVLADLMAAGAEGEEIPVPQPVSPNSAAIPYYLGAASEAGSSARRHIRSREVDPGAEEA